MTRFHHVANGTSTTATLEAAGIPGTRSIWADPLYEGPVPNVPDEELIDIRSRYLGGDEGGEADPVNDLRRWREVLAAHESYDELVLWYEHDLFDQFVLLQLLPWIRAHVPERTPVTLVCIDAFPGHLHFKGLGELSPNELASLFDARRRVTPSQYDLAERAWIAFREPTPQALDDLRRGDTGALPFLSAALTRFMQEYPWTTDGLSRTERRLLHLAEHGPITMRAAFPRMHDDETAYYVTDLSLAALIDTLAQTAPPLLALDGGIHLADAGRDVLSGRKDRVACGVDRWLGGVHLRSGADIWRWNEQRQRIEKT